MHGTDRQTGGLQHLMWPHNKTAADWTLRRDGVLRVCTLQGCFAKLSSFMESNFLMIGGIAVGFSFLQVSSLILIVSLSFVAVFRVQSDAEMVLGRLLLMSW